MGHNPSRNPFKQARPGLNDQIAVDAYKAASICGAWWTLDESTRRRYFTADERKFMRRYGAKLDELSCQRVNPGNEDEHHFVLVCLGQEEPRTSRERLWLYAQMVCRYERSLLRAARTYLMEYENAALRIDNRSLRVDLHDVGVSAPGARRAANNASLLIGGQPWRADTDAADCRFSMTASLASRRLATSERPAPRRLSS